MRRLKLAMDLKLSPIIFRQFHGAVTRSQNSYYAHYYDSALGSIFVIDPR